MDAARAIIDANRYMTLATADAGGVPWASPVWFAPDGEDLLWISRPEAQHSRNLAVRPELSIVIFDSQRAPADTTALYMSATAAQAESGIEVFSAHSVAGGLPCYSLRTSPARPTSASTALVCASAGYSRQEGVECPYPRWNVTDRLRAARVRPDRGLRR